VLPWMECSRSLSPLRVAAHIVETRVPTLYIWKSTITKPASIVLQQLAVFADEITSHNICVSSTNYMTYPSLTTGLSRRPLSSHDVDSATRRSLLGTSEPIILLGTFDKGVR
jgi:hypothetical protein